MEENQRRIKLYRAFVKPCLTYNRATWGLTKALASEIDRCHRRQLRSLIGMRFPNRISNIDLYKCCREEPLSATIEKARMRSMRYEKYCKSTPLSKHLYVVVVHCEHCRTRVKSTTGGPSLVHQLNFAHPSNYT